MAPSNTTRVAGSEKENSVIASCCHVQLRLGSNGRNESRFFSSLRSTQLRHLPVRSPRLLLRAAESLLEARHSQKKKDKRERMGFFSLSAREPGGTGAYRSKFVGALYFGYWAVDEYCPGSVPSPEWRS